jgi:hypothetical protein
MHESRHYQQLALVDYFNALRRHLVAIDHVSNKEIRTLKSENWRRGASWNWGAIGIQGLVTVRNTRAGPVWGRIDVRAKVIDRHGLGIKAGRFQLSAWRGQAHPIPNYQFPPLPSSLSTWTRQNLAPGVILRTRRSLHRDSFWSSQIRSLFITEMVNVVAKILKFGSCKLYRWYPWPVKLLTSQFN